MLRAIVPLLLAAVLLPAGWVGAHTAKSDAAVTGSRGDARPVVPPASIRTVEDVVAAVRQATTRYLDIARARSDGYVQASGMEPNHGYHFVNVPAQLRAAASGLAGDLDLGVRRC